MKFQLLCAIVIASPLGYYEEPVNALDYDTVSPADLYYQPTEEYYDDNDVQYDMSPEEYYDEDYTTYDRVPQNQPFFRRAFRKVSNGVSKIARNPIARTALNFAKKTPIGAKVNMAVQIGKGFKRGGFRGGFNAAKDAALNHPYANLARSGINVGRQLSRGNVNGAFRTAVNTGVQFAPGKAGTLLRGGIQARNRFGRYEEQEEYYDDEPEESFDDNNDISEQE
jgi:hypothetical protein